MIHGVGTDIVRVARLADALCEISRTVDLIERVRPKPINLSNAEHPDV